MRLFKMPEKDKIIRQIRKSFLLFRGPPQGRRTRKKSLLTILAHKKLAELATFEAEYIGIFSGDWYNDLDSIEPINREDPPSPGGAHMRLEDLFDKSRKREERAGPTLPEGGMQRDGSET